MASINWVSINTQVCAGLWDMMGSRMNKEGPLVQFVSLPQSLGALFLQVWLANMLCQKYVVNCRFRGSTPPLPKTISKSEFRGMCRFTQYLQVFGATESPCFKVLGNPPSNTSSDDSKTDKEISESCSPPSSLIRKDGLRIRLVIRLWGRVEFWTLGKTQSPFIRSSPSRWPKDLPLS